MTIKERQIRPYLQPVVDRSGKIVGAEALARWIHPENGFMSPVASKPMPVEDFENMAEKSAV